MPDSSDQILNLGRLLLERVQRCFQSPQSAIEREVDQDWPGLFAAVGEAFESEAAARDFYRWIVAWLRGEEGERWPYCGSAKP